jgi:enoyl-CoA hydratase/carnithine racemase
MRADYPATMRPLPALADLTLELDVGVAVITLTRPERRNAFTGAMGESLGRAYEWCDTNDEIRAVVVTGAGDAFCAGADLAPAGETFAAPRDERAGATREFTSSPVRPPAWEVRKPVIAAVNGHAIGIGMTSGSWPEERSTGSCTSGGA